ncbi:MAG: STAS domain-containing protein [Ferruginibacter sp.]|nr:STAS domain-containing protein [Cytophagales bacterium]
MVHSEKIDKSTVLSFQDVRSLDAPKVFRIKAEFRALITEPNIKLVVDLTDVDFIDSSGIGVLLSVLRMVKSQDGQMKLCSLSANVFDLFMLLHLEHVFEIFVNREKAIASYLPVKRLRERDKEV